MFPTARTVLRTQPIPVVANVEEDLIAIGVDDLPCAPERTTKLREKQIRPPRTIPAFIDEQPLEAGRGKVFEHQFRWERGRLAIPFVGFAALHAAETPTNVGRVHVAAGVFVAGELVRRGRFRPLNERQLENHRLLAGRLRLQNAFDRTEEFAVRSEAVLRGHEPRQAVLLPPIVGELIPRSEAADRDPESDHTRPRDAIRGFPSQPTLQKSSHRF